MRLFRQQAEVRCAKRWIATSDESPGNVPVRNCLRATKSSDQRGLSYSFLRAEFKSLQPSSGQESCGGLYPMAGRKCFVDDQLREFRTARDAPPETIEFEPFDSATRRGMRACVYSRSRSTNGEMSSPSSSRS